MAVDYTNIDEVVNDFQLMIDDTSYDKEAQIYQLRLLALQGLRELTFDIEQVVKTDTRVVGSSSLTISLPDDFVKLLKNYVPFRLLSNGAIAVSEMPIRSEIFAYQNIIFIHKKWSPDKNMKPTSNI